MGRVGIQTFGFLLGIAIALLQFSFDRASWSGELMLGQNDWLPVCLETKTT